MDQYFFEFAESLFLVFDEEVADEVLGFFGNADLMFLLGGPLDFPVLDHVVHLVLVGVVEGGYPHNHLVNKNSEGPPVK